MQRLVNELTAFGKGFKAGQDKHKIMHLEKSKLAAILTSTLGTVAEMKEDQKEFDLKCSLLPKEEADKLKMQRKQVLKDKINKEIICY